MRAQLFGKLPAHGDFIARGLDAATRAALDGWLARGIADARARHGETFDDAYDAAPPWRYVGEDAGGAIAASIDRVGRRFPVWLMLTGLPPERAESAADRCEALLYDALAQGWDADALVARAEEVDLAADATRTCGWRLDELVVPGARPEGLIARMLAARAEARA